MREEETMENTLIENLRETVKTLRHVADTAYAAENDLAGVCPAGAEKMPSFEGESALGLAVMVRGLADTLLHDVERIGQMIGARSPVPAPVSVPVGAFKSDR